VKAQCDRCKEIVPLEFALADDHIKVHCPSCDARYPVSPLAEARSPRPEAPNQGVTCPKCGEDQPTRDSCRRCGLVFERWRGVEAVADASELPIATATELAARWKALTDDWSDAARHDAFVAACRAAGAFGYAAVRYRSRGTDPVATARLAEIRILAEQSLATPSRAEPTLPPGRVIAISGLVVIIAFAGYYFWKALEVHPRVGPRSDIPHPSPPTFQPDRTYGPR
jgi:hypothetical protein